MNTWILHDDLPAIIAAAANPAVRALAQVAYDNYQYPVDDQVISPEGKLLGQLEANAAMGDESLYVQLLDYALGLADTPPDPERVR